MSVSTDYEDLLADVLENGTKNPTERVQVLFRFGRQLRYDLSESFPLITTKRVH